MSAPTINAPNAAPDADDRLRRLTTADLAERFARSQQTIRVWVAEEGLPAHRAKRRLYFDPVEVEAWLRARSGDAATPAPADDGPDPALPSGDAEWLAATLAKFSPDDLRRVAQVLRSVADDHARERSGGAA